jgi:hypothetical protein
MRRARRLGQGVCAYEARRDANRHVHREQPLPRCYGQYSAREGGSRRGGYGDDQRIDADAASEQAMRIDEAYQRGIHAHDAGGAKALNNPCERKRYQRVRQGARKRGSGE